MVELAASWAIVMILSEPFLWWPRGREAAGVLYPRFRSGGRRFWRDLYGVTGCWVPFVALFLLVSGLPWAKTWGGYLKMARAVVEDAPRRQDWSVGRDAELRDCAAADCGTRAMMGEHTEHGGMTIAHPAISYTPLNRLVVTVASFRLTAPVLIAPLTGAGPAPDRQVGRRRPSAAHRPDAGRREREDPDAQGLRAAPSSRPDRRLRHECA